ncbi:MAG: acetolactate synthase [Actinomycetota bacterium]|nr:acetolactate synthase [Actinomycetota bacterium]
MSEQQGHGGRAVSLALKALGVEHLFTLTGGHIFPILDGCRQDGIRIVDVRHEQSAAFAAEGWARLTRKVGVAAITAGPGVTNAMSALAQARFNRAPIVTLAGRAPTFRWGQGSLQEIDHIPFVQPIAPAKTVTATDEIAHDVITAVHAALTAPRGPRFLDFPLDVLFDTADIRVPDAQPVEPPSPDPGTVQAIADLVAQAQRPILIAGSNVWMDGAEGQLVRLAETAAVPVFMNGQGRGCLPADHHLAFARSRSKAMKEADLVVVIGTPMDFRLGFGQNFASGAKVVHVDSHAELIAEHVALAASLGAPLKASLAGIADALEGRSVVSDHWADSLETAEREKGELAEAELRSGASPIHPMRVYGELVPLLDRNAIVIGDGGDFVSYAGREVPSFHGGSWLDPGPYGCLGVGPGYAAAARLAYPKRQVVALFGDGAIGFSGTELETLVRLGLPVVCVVGNNGIWGLEKHPMRALYGHDVAADLQPGLRYDRMMEAFGGRGELVADPEDIAPALKRAFDAGEPYLVNVLTDPDVAYPRSANLA